MKILATLTLQDHHRQKGNCIHFKNGSEIESPSSLQIAQFDGDPGLLLLYLDKDGNELTDTYHEALDRLLDQANFEFDVRKEDWASLPEANKLFPSLDGKQE